MNTYNEVRQALAPAIGVPFKALAPALGIELPKDAIKRKAAGGDIAEALLDIARNSVPEADLAQLGTEVKTIPLNTLSRPRENTKIKAFNVVATQAQVDFRRSALYAKLRSILFVPIMKQDNSSPDFWYIRPPFLWLPTEAQVVQMERDYELIQAAAVRRDWDALSGMPGESLTVNTSGDTTKGKLPELKGRAWWLKASFTRGICAQNLWPHLALAQRSAERAFLDSHGFDSKPQGDAGEQP